MVMEEINLREQVFRKMGWEPKDHCDDIACDVSLWYAPAISKGIEPPESTSNGKSALNTLCRL